MWLKRKRYRNGENMIDMIPRFLFEIVLEPPNWIEKSR